MQGTEGLDWVHSCGKVCMRSCVSTCHICKANKGYKIGEYGTLSASAGEAHALTITAATSLRRHFPHGIVDQDSGSNTRPTTGEPVHTAAKDVHMIAHPCTPILPRAYADTHAIVFTCTGARLHA